MTDDARHDPLGGRWEGEAFPKYLAWRLSPHGGLVYGLIERLVERMRGQRKSYSMFAIINVARWEYDLTGRDIDGFKISNSHSPYLARELTYSGVAPVGFLELVGGTPHWFVDWARDPDRLNHRPRDRSYDPVVVKLPVPAAPVPAAPKPPECPVVDCALPLDQTEATTLGAGWVVGHCAKHGRQMTRWST